MYVLLLIAFKLFKVSHFFYLLRPVTNYKIICLLQALAELAKSRHKDGLLAAIRWHSLLGGKSVCAILLLGVATFSPHIGRAATLRIYPFWF